VAHPAKKPAAGRAAGKRIRDPERTRTSILDAATREFARHGLGGARVDRIATRAGANKRMLYYYFGDKDALFRAVLEHAYARIRTAEQALRLLDVPPAEGVRRLVEFTWHYYLAHPEFITLLNSENLHRGQHLRRSRHISTMNTPVIATLAEILKRGAATGEFRRDADPLQLYVSIAALAYFYLSNNHTLSAVFGRDLATPAARAERLAHMVDMVLGYLAATPGPGRLTGARPGRYLD
jgi:AcrR family transcriptional regulator